MKSGFEKPSRSRRVLDVSVLSAARNQIGAVFRSEAIAAPPMMVSLESTTALMSCLFGSLSRTAATPTSEHLPKRKSSF